MTKRKCRVAFVLALTVIFVMLFSAGFYKEAGVQYFSRYTQGKTFGLNRN